MQCNMLVSLWYIDTETDKTLQVVKNIQHYFGRHNPGVTLIVSDNITMENFLFMFYH